MIAWALLGLAGCTEYAYTQQVVSDFFQQNRRQTVDILMVIDNSCSMIEEQDKLATSFEAFIGAFEGVDVDWRIGAVTTDTLDPRFQGRLLGGDDEIILATPEGAVIDEVAWDRDWAILPGVALALDPASLSSAGNDQPSAWCEAATPFGDGDLGTPGEPNPACGERSAARGGGWPAAKGDGTVRAPAVGDLVISEFLADPAAVPDAVGEWVELQNTTADTLDISGYQLLDRGRNLAVLPEGTLVPPGAAFVVGRSDDPSVNGGVVVDVAIPEGFTLQNDVRVLDPDTEGADEIFAEMVAVGTSGSGIEMGLEAAALALTEPLASGENAGFVRDDANLNIIFISDEDDSSPRPVWEYQRIYTDVKGEAAWRDHAIMRVSAVVGSQPPEFEGDPSCASDSGLGWYGPRYIELVEATEGQLESICEDDFSPIAERLGLLASGLAVEFELSELPNLATLVVSLYSSPDDAGFERTLERDVDYSYVAERNAIRFEEDQVPPSEWYILAEYVPLASGAANATTAAGGAP